MLILTDFSIFWEGRSFYVIFSKSTQKNIGFPPPRDGARRGVDSGRKEEKKRWLMP